MEADVLRKAAMKPRLPTGLGKRFAFPTAPTAPASDPKQSSEAVEAGSAPLIPISNPTGQLTC